MRVRAPFSSLLLAGTIACVMVLAPAFVVLSSPAAVAAVKTHTAPEAKPKLCFETGTFKHRTVRVPTSCSAPRPVRECFLASRYRGKEYRVQVNCAGATKAVSTGSSGSTAASGATGATRPGSGTTGNIPAGEGVNWSTAKTAFCDDASAPTADDGDFSCDDGSSPYCKDATAFVVVDPLDQGVVCLPNASVPATGVCDDGSNPGSGGVDDNGAQLCQDGDNAYYAGDTADDSASNGSCDDGSNPGDGGSDAGGTPLCADGSYPSYDY